MKVLVTGGAGFIGSHTVVELVARGHEPVIVDDLSNAKPGVLDSIANVSGSTVPFAQLDVRDTASLAHVFARHRPDAVIHFAAYKSVGESWERPLDYHHNNVGGLLSVLQCMRAAGTRDLVFSSSATVYGEASASPIPESAPIDPRNPYAQSKALCERVLLDVHRAGICRSAILRYFNPVGAHPSGMLGEDPNGVPNNLMPYVCQVASGRLPYLRVFGSDYPTPDGTGVRDYLHVMDLAEAHVAALDALPGHPLELIVNLGRGEGHSVLQVVEAFERTSGERVPLRVDARRPGDVAVCFADVSRSEAVLGWRARRDLRQMCEDAWLWETRRR